MFTPKASRGIHSDGQLECQENASSIEEDTAKKKRDSSDE